MKLSIIIPIYNVERYIDRCLKSCVQQDIAISEYEIIIVNDGTPDNSMEVVQKYALSYSNIVIVEQENKGLSEARNTGLRMAKGDYVWFVDSDDYIETNCLQAITDQIFDRELDALQIPIFKVCHEDKTCPYDYSKLDKNVYCGKELLSRSQYKYPAQFTLYKRLFLSKNKLYFFPNIYHEDMDFSPRAYFFAQRVGFYASPVYYYEQGNSSSIMHNRSIKRAFDMIHIIQRHITFLAENSNTTIVLSSFGTTIGQLLNNSMNIVNRVGTKEQKNDFLTRISKIPQIQTLMQRSNNLYFQFEAFLFRISPRLLLLFHQLIHFYRR